MGVQMYLCVLRVSSSHGNSRNGEIWAYAEALQAIMGENW